MDIEYTKETVWTDDLGTHRVQTEPKPRTLKKDLARLGTMFGKVAAFIFLLAAAVALIAGVFLLLGWGLAAGLAFVTSGVIALNVLQGAVAVALLISIASLFRA